MPQSLSFRAWYMNNASSTSANFGPASVSEAAVACLWPPPW